MGRKRLRYKIFEHTADVGLYAYGSGLEELFANAAAGLMSLVVGTSEIAAVEETPISLEAGSAEELLRAWLAELLYFYNAEGKLFAGAEFTTLTDTRLEAVVQGETLDPARHEVACEVKAVTWHGLRVERGKKGRLRAALVLDV
ncbi:MAG: archease [Candidatus Glassbacteria bacterium]|nr:archease [Candidatus Glassbacteria bacterium]